MIDIKDLSKVYLVGDERVRALDHATLHIYPKEFVSIIGPSGSGKSTLMNIIGCLDVADAGSYCLDGLPIETYTENELALIRNEKIGFVFQNFNLIQKTHSRRKCRTPLNLPKNKTSGENPTCTRSIKTCRTDKKSQTFAYGIIGRTTTTCSNCKSNRNKSKINLSR